MPIAGMALSVPDGAITDDKLAHPVSRITLLDRHTGLYDSYSDPSVIDGNWHDVDTSGKIPSSAQAVIVQVGLTSSTTGRVHVGPGGEHQGDYLSVTAHQSWDFTQGIVKVKNGSISFTSGTSVDRFWITMIGYIE